MLFISDKINTEIQKKINTEKNTNIFIQKHSFRRTSSEIRNRYVSKIITMQDALIGTMQMPGCKSRVSSLTSSERFKNSPRAIDQKRVAPVRGGDSNREEQ